MAEIISRTQLNVCAAVLREELNQVYGGNPHIEYVRIDDDENITIQYDVAPSAQNLTDLDLTLASHVCTYTEDEEQASDVIAAADILSAVGGNITTAVFSNNSTTKNKWLECYGDESSDEVPFIVPFNCKLAALTFSNEEDGVDVDMQLHKSTHGSGGNAIEIFNWELRDIRTAVQSTITPTITLLAGDKIGMYAKDQGTNSKSPRVILYFERVDNVTVNLTENFSGDF